MNGYWNFHHNRSLSHDAAHSELGEANLGLFECSAEEYSEDCGGSARAGVSGRVRQHCYPSRSPHPGVAHGGSAAACGGPQLIGRSTASVRCPANARRASRCAPSRAAAGICPLASLEPRAPTFTDSEPRRGIPPREVVQIADFARDAAP